MMKKIFPYYHKAVKYIGIQDLVYKKANSMHHITENLYLGDFRAADDLLLLNEHKIEHIINCGSFLPNNFPSSFSYLNLGLEDTVTQEILPQMEQAYQYITQNSLQNIFVHCAYGASRSGAVIVYYLMKNKQMTFQQAYDYAISKRSCVKLNAGFIEQLRSIENTITNTHTNVNI